MSRSRTTNVIYPKAIPTLKNIFSLKFNESANLCGGNNAILLDVDVVSDVDGHQGDALAEFLVARPNRGSRPDDAESTTANVRHVSSHRDFFMNYTLKSYMFKG